jgi:acetate---CoA ligase (ADP-forming)
MEQPSVLTQEPRIAHSHALAPMLTPRSVALIGASRKPNSVGNDALRNLLSGGYRGAIYPVNPCYRSLYGCACYSAITELAEPVDRVIVSVPNKVLERTVEQALASGARSLVIFASAELEDDGTSRIAAMARCARVPVCGANQRASLKRLRRRSNVACTSLL